MIHTLDRALQQLLIQKGEIDPALVEICFDTPTRERIAAATTPTINLYLYDLRENVELREMNWDTERVGNQRVRITRRPLRMDLSYMISCWAAEIPDQHKLLWRVVETLSRFSPLPDEFHQDSLKDLQHPVRMQVAQSDGVLKTFTELWSALQVTYQPAIQLVATLDLDLNQVTTTPLVLTRTLHLQDLALGRNHFQDTPLRTESLVER
jgi:Pvc16 N-terminal domain